MNGTAIGLFLLAAVSLRGSPGPGIAALRAAAGSLRISPGRNFLSSLIVVATAAWAAMVPARADDPACQVSGIRGSAMLEHNGGRAAVAAGMALSAGDTISTGPGARVKLRFADGSEVRLGENATLQINLVKIDTAEGTRNILLNLPVGLLRAAAAKVPSASGSSFEIHTGIGYSAVRGTEWIMVATSEETRVYVQEGRVSVGTDFPSTQFPKLVEAGYSVVVRKTGIEAIEASPPGSLDGLIEQSEVAVTDGAPVDDADTTETAETETDSVSNASGAATDLSGDGANPSNAAGSANKTSNGGSSSSGSSSAGGGGGSTSSGGGGASSSGGNGKSSGGGLSGKTGGGGKLK